MLPRSPEADLHRTLESLRQAFTRALERPELAAVGREFQQRGISGTEAIGIVHDMWRFGRYPDSMQQMPVSISGARSDPSGYYLERYLLARCALARLDRLPELPVYAPVKLAICEELQFLAAPTEEWLGQLRPDAYPFRAYCGIALLERFPAGQFCWDRTGVPRSWLLRVPRAKLPALIAHIAFRMTGFGPCVGTHLSVARIHFRSLIEGEYRRAYCWLAKSLAMQPDVKGLVASSWLYSESTFEVSPHLRWMRDLIVKNGGFAAEIGEAPPASGFLVGSATRRKLYESGKFKPRETMVLWSREALLTWARRQPEFTDGLV